MGTSIKTVVFSGEALFFLSDATLTTITSPTIYLPESGIVFRSCWLSISCDDRITATGGTTTGRRVDFGLGAVAQTTYNNTAALANTGENVSLHWEADVTSYFTTNWTGTSMSTDIEVYVDQSTGTTLGQHNVCVAVHITYEYDDTSATQVKTVWLPLDAPVGALATSKPGTATAVIPALDTHLPEASKTYRSVAIWRWGNTSSTGLSLTVTMGIEASTIDIANSHVGNLATSRFVRFVGKVVPGVNLDTSVPQDFFIWGDQAIGHHHSVLMQVTYEFDASASTETFVSTWLNTAVSTHGGHGSADPARFTATLHVPEENVTGAEIAFYGFWSSIAITAGLNARVGTGTYVTYTDAGGVYAGSESLMVRNDAAYTIARGTNEFTADIYATTGFPGALNGFFIVNYRCDVPAAGVHAANKTVSTRAIYNGAVTSDPSGTSETFGYIPESDWRISNVGHVAGVMHAATQGFSGQVSYGDGWRDCFSAVQEHDAEVGWLWYYSASATYWMMRWAGDTSTADDGTARVDPTLATQRRRLRLTGSSPHFTFGFNYTYHSVTWPVAGDVIDSNGGLVRISLHRAHHRDMTGITGVASTDVITTPTPHRVIVGQTVIVGALTGGTGLAAGPYVVATTPSPTTLTLTGGTFTTDISAGTLTLPIPNGGELLKSITRVGDGAYSIDWYDDTEPVYVDMYEDGTHLCRTAPALAGT